MKTVFEIWYDYPNPKYDEEAKLCYMDTESFIVHIKTDDTYKVIAENVETTFDPSNYKLDKPLSKENKKELIRLMQDELGGKIMIKFVRWRYWR